MAARLPGPGVVKKTPYPYTAIYKSNAPTLGGRGANYYDKDFTKTKRQIMVADHIC